MFLETLTRFIQSHRIHLSDWLYILLLKLLQKQGNDMLKSVQYKVQLVLEHVRLVRRRRILTVRKYFMKYL